MRPARVQRGAFPDPAYAGAVEALTANGLGLDRGTIRLSRTTEGWLAVGSVLRDRVSQNLIPVTTRVEHMGSSSVVGLLAKPIIDLAVGARDQDVPQIAKRLGAAGWIYRGDGGDDGGYLFVLEARHWCRIAHLHVVEVDGVQWRNYLRFRDVLRRSAVARSTYEAVKLRLAEAHGEDREAYTKGKTDVVRSILGEHE